MQRRTFFSRDGIDCSKDKVGDESDGEEYFRMNVVHDKYHPGGHNCTYRGYKVPVLSKFLRVGMYQGILSQTYLGT